MVDLSDGEKKIEDMFTRFDTIYKRDGQTDRQTDTARRRRPRCGPTCIAFCNIQKLNI